MGRAGAAATMMPRIRVGRVSRCRAGRGREAVAYYPSHDHDDDVWRAHTHQQTQTMAHSLFLKNALLDCVALKSSGLLYIFVQIVGRYSWELVLLSAA